MYLRNKIRHIPLKLILVPVHCDVLPTVLGFSLLVSMLWLYIYMETQVTHPGAKGVNKDADMKASRELPNVQRDIVNTFGRDSSKKKEAKKDPPMKKPTGFIGKAKVVIVDLFNDIIKRAPVASGGEPWPLPHKVQYNTSVSFVLSLTDFKFVYSDLGHCELLHQASSRYLEDIERLKQYYVALYNFTVPRRPSKNATQPNQLQLQSVTLYLTQTECNGVYPSPVMDESYEINITEDVQSIRANEIWGLLRGLETFYQLLHVSRDSGRLQLSAVHITDHPAYQHRGILIDTGRHFLYKDTIKDIIKAMNQNKMNVLHWHMVDDQSFPFKSETFPALWKMGSFSLHLIYSHQDIKDIVDYARTFGVRVVPEFDTPGHTRSWFGVPDLVAKCGKQNEKMTGVLDLTNQNIYNILDRFYREVKGVFKDSMVHLGGDEISPTCWYLNTTTRKVLDIYTHNELIDQYFQRLHRIISSVDVDWIPVVWEEVAQKYLVKLDPQKTILQLWSSQEFVQEALLQGFRIIYSTCWYLNLISTQPDWHELYDCNPWTLVTSTAKVKGDIIGGEACVWGEYIDNNNIQQILWPRAIAIAERLWSNPLTKAKHYTVQARFQEQYCRMQRRGIKVSPQTGPGSCDSIPSD